jgi:hypothetical protein
MAFRSSIICYFFFFFFRYNDQEQCIFQSYQLWHQMGTYLGCVTIDGVWIGDWLYWPLVYTTRNYTLQITDAHRLVSSTYYSLHYPLVTAACPEFLSTDNSTNWVPGWRPFHQPPSLLVTGWLSTDNWQLNSLTHQPATSYHFSQLNSWQLYPITDYGRTRLTLLKTFQHKPYKKHHFHCYSPTIPWPLHALLWEPIQWAIAEEWVFVYPPTA